ncbi:ELMO/CED-12 family-domain-containing protein [Fimicolochytrium jonesii]|uniref:ELMO/CED-12 family-domain-containing protein n=1 Tax=Fimicolochytrium jonesii TaxID=1396493 RepID=UPI0022FDC78D|nr:ELMO/CED-12 family-domain-containing protein [Fimicolochytrium jonesii]KAI8826738.1 ELMO/CED-12 family-domain-containing protein [Fimicolochytrium jonesii]
MQRFDDDGEQAIESVMRKKGFSTHGGAFTSPASSNFRHCVREIRASYAVVDILQKRAATTFDSGDAQHEKMLLEFWRLAKPNETLRNRISDQWQTIGFQGKDPATDFRGMGLLGLDNLIYYARHHPKSFQRVLEISHHPTAWFSMSIVGINITGFVLELARKGKLQLFFYTFGSSENTFGEVYSYIFDGFAQFWDAQHGITVMDFSRMFKMFQGVVKLDIATMRRPTLLGYTEEEDGGEEKKRL